MIMLRTTNQKITCKSDTINIENFPVMALLHEAGLYKIQVGTIMACHHLIHALRLPEMYHIQDDSGFIVVVKDKFKGKVWVSSIHNRERMGVHHSSGRLKQENSGRLKQENEGVKWWMWTAQRLYGLMTSRR
jgi:hypothetical protein